MDPHSFENLHPLPHGGPPPHPDHPPHPPMPLLPPHATPYDGGYDPVGWWDVITGTWRWVTNPSS